MIGYMLKDDLANLTSGRLQTAYVYTKDGLELFDDFVKQFEGVVEVDVTETGMKAQP